MSIINELIDETKRLHDLAHDEFTELSKTRTELQTMGMKYSCLREHLESSLLILSVFGTIYDCARTRTVLKDTIKELSDEDLVEIIKHGGYSEHKIASI